jgi:proton-translocating NADH-quinone oxidoreductase, chain M
MIPVLLIVIPLVSGLLAFLVKQEKSAKTWSLISSMATMVIAILGMAFLNKGAWLETNLPWLPELGSSFAVKMDGMSQLLCLLTGVAFPGIFIATWHATYRNAHNFHALMLLMQAGLMGVFVAADALVFYFFWELALIPAYFLCSIWGGEKRIAVTFKFFIYTFLGSLFMLIGIIWVYLQTADHSFSIQSFYNANLPGKHQGWVFWMMFLAFAIKIPIFPFHTWQPDTYEQSPTAVTMVLSGVMVKMGVFGILRWLIPIVPVGAWAWGDTVATLCVVGMIYASLVAIQQDDLKKLIAYSSIAHMGLMGLAIFVTSTVGIQGVLIQMFNHGVNIIGLWIVVELIERQLGTRKISELGGLAQKAPTLAILLVVIALANVALPLTNAFVGEFMMFTGVFGSQATKYSEVFMVIGGISIILSAVYTLNMIQRVFYGNTNNLTVAAKDIRFNEKLVLVVLVIGIIVMGVYPKPMIEATKLAVDAIYSKMFVKLP